MSENIRDVLSELIDSYGINILEDPDRLSQFLEDRCALQAEEAFHLTFALRYLLKCGWRVNSARAVLDEEQEERLCQQLGFTAGQSKEVAALINGAVADKYEDGRPAGEGFVATPGNLRRISGGISNRPRTMRMRKNLSITASFCSQRCWCWAYSSSRSAASVLLSATSCVSPFCPDVRS